MEEELRQQWNWFLVFGVAVLGLRMILEGLLRQALFLSPEEALAIFSNMPGAIP